MKNNQIIIGIVAAIIIILGLGGFLLLAKNKASTPYNTSAVTNTNMMQGTIQDIFAGGKNQKCDFDVKESTGGETKGSVSVASDKAYGTFEMTTNGKVTNTYMVRDGDTFYLWGNSLPLAIKTKMSVNDMAKQMSGGNYSNIDPNKKLEFNCNSWTVDESLFTPPANIKFTDVANMMKNTGGIPTGVVPSVATPSISRESQCEICNSLTGPAKTACKTSFKCQ